MDKFGKCKPKSNGSIHVNLPSCKIMVGLHVNQKWEYTVNNLTDIRLDYKNILITMNIDDFNRWFKEIEE
jgi:hypothetical protein